VLLPRYSAVTHTAEDGTKLPLLFARSRHASVRSLKRYARPGPEAVGRMVPEADPPRRRRERTQSDPDPTIADPTGTAVRRVGSQLDSRI
jgi:hypothetical protein